MVCRRGCDLFGVCLEVAGGVAGGGRPAVVKIDISTGWYTTPCQTTYAYACAHQVQAQAQAQAQGTGTGTGTGNTTV